jgi:nucleotide-binding universal stress UspA family protein
VHCYEIPSYAYMDGAFGSVDLITPVEEGAQRVLDDALSEVRKTLPTATGIVRRGAPCEQILETAERVHADLLVLGTHGRRGVSRVLLGSVAERLVRISPVPVLTVRGDQAPAPSVRSAQNEKHA